ncbi:GreA/GreB family elongation factor [Lutibacter sp.]|uniref:GreA/GreB family elongation factor n=1 Tax=Lutibacter sp. TaxID=1925666 RepID=UPI001A33DF3D|nr:GreA/GreB family elongation factor [Lutibacter sp.]MBI9041083.1 GreA/GreB family elongation factor [Lutibacter sp.]
MKDDTQNIKKTLLVACVDFVQKKETVILETIASNKNDLFSETKSSAGDKHETGRAMLQLEMEKASQQLAIVNQMKETLQRLTIEYSSKNVRLGSLVKTTKGTYFLAVSVGQVLIDKETYFVVSTESPIGKQLLGKKIGEVITFNEAQILKIA